MSKDILIELKIALKKGANGLSRSIINLSKKYSNSNKDLRLQLGSHYENYLQKNINDVCASFIKDENTPLILILESLRDMGLITEKDIEKSFSYISGIRKERFSKEEANRFSKKVCIKLFK